MSTAPSSVSILACYAQWIESNIFTFLGRFPLAFQLIPCLLLFGGIWFIQESPRWLMEHERYEDARTVLKKLHGNGHNDDFLDLEYREIHDVIVAERTLSVKSWRGLVSRPSWRKRLLLGCGIQAFGQLSGINVSLTTSRQRTRTLTTDRS